MNKFIVVNLDGNIHCLRKKDIEKLLKINASVIEIKNEKIPFNIFKKADAIIFTKTKITKEIIDNLERCRIIVRCGTGLDNIDVEAATEKKIMVSRVVEFCTEEVSNHAFMLILACSRKLKKFSKFVYKDLSTKDFGYIGGIKGETLGLVGFGKIARALAGKAKSFGMEVIGYDPFIDIDVFNKFGVKKVSLNTVLKASDYVSLHCPLTQQTYHLIGEKELKTMKKTAYLINTSRGSLIDESALIKALKKNYIAGAGLDVFEKEPPSRKNPLLHMENVICTAHYAYYSNRSIDVLKDTVVNEIIRALKGKIPLNLYNTEVLKDPSFQK